MCFRYKTEVIAPKVLSTGLKVKPDLKATPKRRELQTKEPRKAKRTVLEYSGRAMGTSSDRPSGGDITGAGIDVGVLIFIDGFAT